MKFVIAPDKFKGSLSGHQFCEAVERGIKKVFPTAEVIKKPLADGGDGTIEVVKDYLNAAEIAPQVNDPLFRPINAPYLFSESLKTAYIEMSEASGHKLLRKSELNCMHTTSFGTGELIKDAILKGAKEIILGIGGSATNDAGIGMAQALGYQFIDKNGKQLKPIGRSLTKIATIEKSQVVESLNKVNFKVACDVTNPLYGPNGAAYVYGPQKGASLADIKILDKGLENFAKIVKQQYYLDVQKLKGAGAAGGMGAAGVTFLNADLVSGIDLIKELANFDDCITDADWIVTGEGKLDGQTIAGKTISGVLTSAGKKNIPVAALCGMVSLTKEEKQQLGLSYIISVSEGISDLQLALTSASRNVENAAYTFANGLKS